MIRKFTVLVMAVITLSVACKKSDTPTPNSNTGTAAADSTAILGKWNLVAEWGTDYDNGIFVDSGHTDVTADDYLFLDTNGKLYNRENDANNNFQSETDTSYYKVADGHYLLGNDNGLPAPLNDTIKILVLDANNLKLASQYTQPSYQYPGKQSIEYDTLVYKR